MDPAVETSGPALRVSGAARRLAARQVLRDVDLVVPRGAVVVLAGPNGAGKSSLLKAIGGRLFLEAGTVEIDGRPAAEARRRGRLGVVPQDIALAGHLSVRENLRLWARLAGAPARGLAATIGAALDAIGLGGRAASRVDELSGGMRRRVNVLAGVLHRPAALMLDEPTVGIDDVSRTGLWALLTRLRDEGMGVLVATHDLDELSGLVDAVAVMDHGAVVASDTVAGLMARFGATTGEIAVALASEAATTALVATGFTPRGGREWVRPVSGGQVDLAALDRDLRRAGVDVHEIRYRRPTLEGAVATAIARAREGRPA